MTRLYYAGAEIPSWRTFLHSQGVRHVSLSFIGLSRRVKFVRPWLLSTKFRDDTEILLDSGGYSLRANPEKYREHQLMDFAKKYKAFVAANVERASLIGGWDVPCYPLTDLEVAEMAGDKYLPIWHAEDGLPRLRELADTYGRVGVPQTSVGGRDIMPVLRTLARSGIKLHGVAMTKPDILEALPWDSAASTSWLSPSQYNDTIVWTGNELKRYPKKYAEQARKRHRQLFVKNGFDAELIESGDSNELLRLSLWSWQRYIDHLNEKRLVTVDTENRRWSFAEEGDETVANDPSEKRKRLATPRRREAAKIAPGFGVEEVEERVVGEDGNFTTRKLNLINVSGESQRLCDTCFLNPSCQEFEPGATCVYKLPVEARTVEQKRRIQDMYIEIQSQRVAAMYAAEQQEGGYADPNLTREVEVLHKMLSTVMSQDAEGFSMTIKASGRAAAGTGLVGQLFGDKAAEKAQALPEAVPADDVLKQMGVIPGEIIRES
ncbi:hypothetical protein [Nonomuraea sp. SYSU D8015]|uniref:hypothetical protein n=1 Tax=Nonomuraea sp. SYSU D8015 TaxID=2593644 RepID=UPI001660E82C|nr:hypothetical protein [Nonomuraea sp. SYSU D8015]